MAQPPPMHPGAMPVPMPFKLEPGQQPSPEQIRQMQQMQQPSPEQIQQMQAQIAAEAQKAGLSVPEFVERMKAQAMHQQRMQAQIAAEAEKAGMSVPEFVERMKAQAMQQQQMRQNMSPEQLQQLQQQQQAQLAAEAEKAGMTVPEFVEQMKAQVFQQRQNMTPEQQQQLQQQQQAQMQQMQAQQQQQGGARPGQQVPIAPGPPKPEAIAVANFLRSQDLKMRTCIFQEKRKDMFKVKRAIRAFFTPAYEKARKKNPLLPEVKDRVTAENTFKLLPLSMLALRVSKHDPHEGHDHGKKKRTKGLWTVKIEPQQEARDDFHYVWLYEGSQWKNKLYAVGALALILAVVFFPVWPYHLRLGVWYLSMGMLGLLGCFFAMAFVRLIIFLITMFTHAPGFWLFPNLFEDVGFFDSFKPAYAWHEDEAAVKQRKKTERDEKKAKREAKSGGKKHVHSHDHSKAATPEPTAIPEKSSAEASTTGTEDNSASVQQRTAAQPAQVEEADDE